ncbi:hypothetical protein GCM10010421_01050 [Streptomyces glaucus]|uniref:Uncharacterized protein n=1 Tax=Streptomyces glaucus TaxID=284029 RepID=A0ABP5W6A3_9ACTN
MVKPGVMEPNGLAAGPRTDLDRGQWLGELRALMAAGGHDSPSTWLLVREPVIFSRTLGIKSLVLKQIPQLCPTAAAPFVVDVPCCEGWWLWRVRLLAEGSAHGGCRYLP